MSNEELRDILDIERAEMLFQADGGMLKDEHVAFMCGEDSVPALKETFCGPEVGPEAEIRHHINAYLAQFVLAAIKGPHSVKMGSGWTHDYYVVNVDTLGEAVPSSISPLAARTLGVLRLRPVPRLAKDAETGEEKWYYGLPRVLRDGRKPVEETIHAAKVGMLLHEKGVAVPFQYALISDYGADEIVVVKDADGTQHIEETGVPIPGMESECVELLLVTEIIHGKTFEHICDPDEIFRYVQVGSYRSRLSVDEFFTEYGCAIYENVWHAILENPLMQKWDMDEILSRIEHEVKHMHIITEKYPGILHNDLHIGNIIIAPDGKSVTLIDFDKATVVNGAPDTEAGTTLEAYPHQIEYTDSNRTFHMPDGPYISTDPKNADKAHVMHAMEQYRLYGAFIGNVIADFRDDARYRSAPHCVGHNAENNI